MTSAFNLSQFANKVNTSGQADLTTAVTGVLPVANGGTGLSSPGTSGNVLQSNGTSWASNTVAFWTGARGQVFTASGTFTIPSGITTIKVTVVAGGNSGGSSSWIQCAGVGPGGGGGGAGGVAIKFFTGLTPGNTLTVTVGGAAAASSVASGTQTITTVSATAGSAGGNTGGLGGSGGVGSGGDINYYGGDGYPGINTGGSEYSGQGGKNLFSGSIRGVGANTVGTAGRLYGGGGSGGKCSSTTSRGGGAGAAGIVVIEW